jgi:twinkle protein
MSVFVKHGSCPKCGSKDNLAIYDDHQHCFSPSCDYYERGTDEEEPIPQQQYTHPQLRHEGVYGAIPDRRISEKVAKQYKVRIEYGSNGKIAKHHYPFMDNKGRISAYKTRAVDTKDFKTNGEFKDTTLFGEHLWDKGGKYITITEGEIDCLSIAEVFNGKWAVVSLKNGASSVSKSLQGSLEFLESFESIVLAFDNDEAGQLAIEKALELFSPDKIKIMSLPEGYKDASDMLKAGLVKELENCWWRSKTWTPSDIQGASELRSAWLERPDKQSVPYPWVCLNNKTKGFRRGELVTITSGTGMGKSSLIRELEHHLLTTTEDKIGIIHLEETNERTLDGLVGISLNVPYHLDDIRQQYDKAKATAAFDKLFVRDNGEEPLTLYDGKELSVDKIVSRIRLMAKTQNIKWVILDHLNLVMSGDVKIDERRNIDALMTKLREVVVETNIGLFVVSHLSRQQGKPHEEGGIISLSHLRGSQGIAQLSNIVIALERDQQAVDENERNIVTLRILKNRYTGETGETGHLKYHGLTGRIKETLKETEIF